jgi:hypothetical protein
VVALPLLDIAAVVAAPSRSEVSHALRCVLCGFELGLGFESPWWRCPAAAR